MMAAGSVLWPISFDLYGRRGEGFGCYIGDDYCTVGGFCIRGDYYADGSGC